MCAANRLGSLVTVLPRRSPGVVYAPSGDGVVAYDLVTETRHRSSPAAGMVLDACDGITDRHDAVIGWAEQASTEPSVVAVRLDEVLQRFTELGLVGRTTAWQPPPTRVAGPRPDPTTTWVGAAHPVLARTVRFHGADRDLVERVDHYLGSGSPTGDEPGEHPTLWFEVVQRGDGDFDLVTDRTVGHAGLGTLLRRLVTVMNEYATGNDDLLTLHAAGLRSPAGRIVVLPGVVDAGKSTLAAALISAGWDYLGDEAIGIDTTSTVYGYPKPLSLDRNGRTVVGLGPDPDPIVDPADLHVRVERLGGRVGPLGTVIFPTYRTGADPQISTLEPGQRLDELLVNSLNLARLGQPGFETLCAVAAEVPTYRLVHGDAVDAAAMVTELVDRTTGVDPVEPEGSSVPRRWDGNDPEFWTRLP